MPTGYKPTFRIYKGGVDLTDRFNDRTTSITVDLSSTGQSDTCEISVDDRDWRIAFPQVGDALEVHLGYEGIGLSLMGTFSISDVYLEGPPRSIRILGTSLPLNSALKVPRLRNFTGRSLGEMVGDIAANSGLTAKVHPALAAKLIPTRHQSSSDMHFLSEIERMFGAVVKINGGSISLTPRDSGETASGLMVPVLQLTPEHFGSWSVHYTERTTYSGVRAFWFDREANVRRAVVVPAPPSFAQSLGLEELGELEFGIPDLGEISFDISSSVFGSELEAREMAQSQMAALVRGSASFAITLAKGDPWIRDQQRLQIAGMRDGIDGSYVIDYVMHAYSGEGLKTTIQGNRVGSGEEFPRLFQPDFLNNLSPGVIVPLPGQLLGEALKSRAGLVEAVKGVLAQAAELG